MRMMKKSLYNTAIVFLSLLLMLPSSSVSVFAGQSESITMTVSIENPTFDPPDPIERIYVYLNNKRVAMEEDGQKYFYYPDHLGSTSTTTDASGREVKYLEYYPYGSTKVETGSKEITKKFTGKELDSSTGLYNYGARHYDTNICRFITADPMDYSDAGIKQAGGKSLQEFLINPQGLNRYSYCLNNPLKYIDPLGLWVAIGSRDAVPTMYHTVIIIHPDNPSDFENNPNFSNRFYRNSKGELEATLSANPRFKKFIALKLVATPKILNDRPEKLDYMQRVLDPKKRSDTQLIKDIFASADKYKDDLSYEALPFRSGSILGDDVGYNSNSYSYGILKDAGIANIPNLSKWEPGADKPIPLDDKM